MTFSNHTFEINGPVWKLGKEMFTKLTVWFIFCVLIALSNCDVKIPENAHPVDKDDEPITMKPTTQAPTTATTTTMAPTTTETQTEEAKCRCNPGNMAAATHTVFQKKPLILMGVMVAIFIIYATGIYSHVMF